MTRAAESPAAARRAVPVRVALLGNPNTGKTTLFNRLCGARAKTANFPGVTVEHRSGTAAGPDGPVEVVDLPGTYSLALELPESRLCRDCLDGRIGDMVPDVAVLVLDANNLHRNLQFAAGALRRRVPFVAAVTMTDLAAKRGLTLDARQLEQRLGCPVVCVSGRTGEGADELLAQATRAARLGMSPELEATRYSALPPAAADSAAVAAWASDAVAASAGGPRARGRAEDSLRDRLDAAFTHPVAGILTFIVVMAGLFACIFWAASFPMDAVDWMVGHAGAAVGGLLPDGPIRGLLVDGVIAGVGVTLVFLPQICLLFFLITLLEDSGYLARAAFAVDRVMCRFGLPGQAFVPLLSSHACALPGILSTRLIPDRRDRLATILVAPFMTCSARLQVYTLLITLLFAGRPIVAAAAFVGCYALGAGAGLFSALIARRTILRGPSRPMVLELPPYQWPSLGTALLTTWDRGMTFIRNAATVILSISVVMWWLSAYPQAPENPQAARMRADAEVAVDPAAAEALRGEADRLQARAQQAGSFAGRIGSAAEPLFSPLGMDRQLTVAVITSFMAREVFANTVCVLAGAPGDDVHDRDVLATIGGMTRDDGSPLFTPATCASVLVFFVLAMQCLPTMALVRRETGEWRWVILQFVWMSAVAWVAAFAAYHGLRMLGFS